MDTGCSVTKEPSIARVLKGVALRDEEASSARSKRRRAALLRLASRYGVVKVALRRAGRVQLGAAAKLDLLDKLNEEGLLTYGGWRAVGADADIVYFSTT